MANEETLVCTTYYCLKFMDSNNNSGCYAKRFERLFESGRVFHETPNEVTNQMTTCQRILILSLS